VFHETIENGHTQLPLIDEWPAKRKGEPLTPENASVHSTLPLAVAVGVMLNGKMLGSVPEFPYVARCTSKSAALTVPEVVSFAIVLDVL